MKIDLNNPYYDYSIYLYFLKEFNIVEFTDTYICNEFAIIEFRKEFIKLDFNKFKSKVKSFFDMFNLNIVINNDICYILLEF